ncbi:MAG: cob(I)yrinic acid a,c-diamide adenosyltransferase [Acidimicrobiales bacterium]
MVVAPSLVLVNTGNGKGQVDNGVRHRHPGSRPGMAGRRRQFLKEWRLRHRRGEDLRDLGVEWHAEATASRRDSEDLDESQAHAKGRGRWRSGSSSGDHRLVVLDEISYALTWHWIDLDDVVDTITNRRPRPA